MRLFNNKNKQDIFLLIDQMLDSGLTFLFIAVGGVLLLPEDMSKVVWSQSIALLCVLFISCFTTQYLLLRYAHQGFRYWGGHFFVFVFLSVIVIYASFSSLHIVVMYLALIMSEFLRRYAYYTNKSDLALVVTCLTLIVFLLSCVGQFYDFYILGWNEYIYTYSLTKVFFLTILFFVFVNSDHKDEPYKKIDIYSFKESISLGFVFSVITVVYWLISQGFLIYSKGVISDDSFVEIRVSQNVFGLVTMFISVFDAYYLKRNKESSGVLFDKVYYIKLALFVFVFSCLNIIFVYFLSVTVYAHLRLMEYAWYFFISQILFLLSRLPVLIIKIRYSIQALLYIYVFSFLISAVYYVIRIDPMNSFVVVESLLIGNLTLFLAVFCFAIVKEMNYEQVN
jgi:hypothetical protein